MRPRSLVLTVLAALLSVAACSSGAPDRTAAGPRVRIVGQNFTEADVVSQLYRALLDEAGFSAKVVAVGGRDLYLRRLEKGTEQVAGDSLSVTTDALNNRAHGDDALPVSSADATATLRQLTRLGDEVGLAALRPARAELKSGFAVTRERAGRLGLRSLSDLGRLGQPVALAGSPDCAERLDCAEGLENVYGITLSKIEPLGSGTPATKAALAKGEVQLAQVATTDSQIGSGLVLLADDRHLLNAENVVPLVNSAWLAHHGDASAALDKLAPVLTTEDLRAMTARVNTGHLSARSVARTYLEQKGLLNSR
jgi:osmoprotectant transport system substrate-binding protein